VNEKLQETAMRVADLTPARIAELTGIKQRRIAHFVNEPGSVTFVELERIRRAVTTCEAADATR